MEISRIPFTESRPNHTVRFALGLATIALLLRAAHRFENKNKIVVNGQRLGVGTVHPVLDLEEIVAEKIPPAAKRIGNWVKNEYKMTKQVLKAFAK